MKHRFVVCLIAAVLITAAAAEETALAARITRLHILAASDSAADQRLKLQLRDALLQEAPALIAGSGDGAALVCAFQTAAEEALDALGSDQTVTVTLGREHYETRRYDRFALPAGDYRSLRVVIGSGEGRNWWCVLFPPLCFAGCEEFQRTAEEAGLTDDEIALLTGRDGGFVLRFRLVELVERLIAEIRRL